MSKFDGIKAGDRVCVVLEGEVTEAGTFEGNIDIGFNQLWDGDEVVSVEKVASPVVTFSPGDVVRGKGGGLLFALLDDGYTCLSGSRRGVRIPYGGFAYEPSDFTGEHFELVNINGEENL